MGSFTKDISCGFSSLSMKEFKEVSKRKTTHYLDIKGGSPDMPIDFDDLHLNANSALYKKVTKKTPKIKIKLRFAESFSDEGKFNIAMLPST